jgi:hypothetical protein
MPLASVLLMQSATLFALSATAAQPGMAAAVTLSVKVTEPEGVVPPAGAETVAVKVTCWL